MINFLRSLKRIYRLITLRPNIKNITNDYDDYWDDVRGRDMGSLKVNSFQMFRALFISKEVSDSGSESLLDIGSGDGAVLNVIRKNFNGKIYATDISDNALRALAKMGFDPLKFDINDAGNIDGLPVVDHISILEVLEHMPNPELFLTNLMSNARKSIFFSIPNSGYFPYRIRLLLGSFPMQWISHPGEHLRFWTYSDLVWWLKQLTISESSRIVGYEGIPVLNRLLPSLFSEAFIVKVELERS